MDPRYPTGKYEDPVDATAADRVRWIDEMALLPGQVRAAVASLNGSALDKPYREGGWTGRQVVHHLADSHVNAYIRFRLALTEDQPVIKPYQESQWAELEDARSGDVALSLELLEHLHRRWVVLLRSLGEEQWTRQFVHPEMGVRDLTQTLALYAWHGRHHLGHLGLL